MAFIQQTVNGIDAAYTELVNFITTHSDLTANGEEWTKVGDYAGTLGTGEYFRGVGNSINHVFILIVKRKIPASKVYNLIIYTFSNYNAALTNAPEQQEGVSLASAIVPVNDTDPIEMLVSANGRRITGFFHTLSNWMNFYVGMFIPYSEPSRYTFPVACIGQVHDKDDALDYDDHGFINTERNFDHNGNSIYSACVYRPNGQQLHCLYERANGVDSLPVVRFTQFYPNLIPSPGGVEPLFPVKMAKFSDTQPYGTGEYFGELDGVKIVSGIGQQTGKIITESDGTRWFVAQSGKHSSTRFHHAFRMS